jgi:putative peptidoglycan lipid II flippase
VSRSPTLPTKPESSGIAQAASIIALGSIASRVLGLIREQLIAYLFGATDLVSAFGIAAKIPKMIYELLIGGMLSAALVPVFSQEAEEKGHAALWLAWRAWRSLPLSCSWKPSHPR